MKSAKTVEQRENFMNAAKLAKSQRLQRVLKVLKKYKHLTTMAIIEKANVCAVNSCIAELRENGHKITCTRSGDIWTYHYVS